LSIFQPRSHRKKETGTGPKHAQIGEIEADQKPAMGVVTVPGPKDVEDERATVGPPKETVDRQREDDAQTATEAVEDRKVDRPRGVVRETRALGDRVDVALAEILAHRTFRY